jgi:hypothetical protein
MKECSKCGEVKPFTEFHKNSCNKDGYNYQCKVCRKEGCASYFSSLSKDVRDSRNERKKKWAETNKEHVKTYSAKYAKENKATKCALQRKREASKKHRTPPWLTEEDFLRIKCYYQVAVMRNKETDIIWHVDHIVPMQGKNVSGLHVPWNLAVIPASENLRKHNKHE